MTLTPEELQKQIDAARGMVTPKPIPESEADTGPGDDRKGASVGITMVASVMVCAFMGIAVDEWMHSKPFGLIIFLLLGIASGFYTVYKASKGT